MYSPWAAPPTEETVDLLLLWLTFTARAANADSELDQFFNSRIESRL